MKDIGFASSFIFKYSPRPRTKAAELADDVPADVKKKRHAALLALQNRMTLRAHEAQAGAVQRVLVEGPSKTDPAMMQGRTGTFYNVVFPGSPALAGTFVNVRMTRATQLTLYGVPATGG